MGEVGLLFRVFSMQGEGFWVGGGFGCLEEGGLIEDVFVGGELEVGLGACVGWVVCFHSII
jgi:hypothetical protein